MTIIKQLLYEEIFNGRSRGRFRAHRLYHPALCVDRMFFNLHSPNSSALYSGPLYHLKKDQSLFGTPLKFVGRKISQASPTLTQGRKMGGGGWCAVSVSTENIFYSQ